MSRDTPKMVVIATDDGEVGIEKPKAQKVNTKGIHKNRNI